MEITFENIDQINENLQNKIFICDQTSYSYDSLDEDENEFHIDVVQQKAKPKLLMFQLGDNWIKCKFDNGQTYLYDAEFSQQQMFEKHKLVENIDFTAFSDSVATMLQKNKESRFQACKSCTLNSVIRLKDKNELDLFFRPMTDFIESMKDSTRFIATESIVSTIQEILDKISDENFNPIDENNVIILKINGFPSAFYTKFDITQYGNIEFNKAFDPILWFGQTLENMPDNIDDKLAAL